MLKLTCCILLPRHVAGSLLAHPDYALNAGSDGLPLAKEQPTWLLKSDALVVDARHKDTTFFEALGLPLTCSHVQPFPVFTQLGKGIARTGSLVQPFHQAFCCSNAPLMLQQL